jgi:hypothetical protein
LCNTHNGNGDRTTTLHNFLQKGRKTRREGGKEGVREEGRKERRK